MTCTVYKTRCGHHFTVQEIPSVIAGSRSNAVLVTLTGPRINDAAGRKTIRDNKDEKSIFEMVAYQLGIPTVHLNVISKEAENRPSSTAPQRHVSPKKSETSARPNPSNKQVISTESTNRASSTPSQKILKPQKSETRAPSTSSKKKLIAKESQYSAPSTPSKKPLFDDVQLSPSGRALCRKCKNKIQAGSVRVCMSAIFQGKEIYKYYHPKCCSPEIRNSNELARRISTLQINKAKRDEKVADCADLKENLKVLRLAFARKLKVSAFVIFDDKTLDDIVFRMPRSCGELLNCYGIGEKRLANFGLPILQTIAAYRKRKRSISSSPVQRSAPVRKKLNMGPANKDAKVNKDDEEICVSETLTIEEIVARRFLEAEQKGEVITL